MRFSRMGVCTLLLVSAGVLGSAFAGPPAIPPTPAGVLDVLYAKPFTLKEAAEHTWRADRHTYTAGYLLVLKVNPDLVYPRQTLEPILYVGNQTAQRLHVGYPSGKIVVIVPGDVDLTKDPIWFNTPESPEAVDAKVIARERQAAERVGIKPLSSEKVTALLGEKPTPVKLQDWGALMGQVADLIEKYIPEQADLADTFRSKPDTIQHHAPGE
jgi:hypothetical protein